jgi:hypothetical protein
MLAAARSWRESLANILSVSIDCVSDVGVDTEVDQRSYKRLKEREEVSACPYLSAVCTGFPPTLCFPLTLSSPTSLIVGYLYYRCYYHIGKSAMCATILLPCTCSFQLPIIGRRLGATLSGLPYSHDRPGLLHIRRVS